MERIGIIGGSGLYKMEGLEIKEELSFSTPFGDPSDKYICGQLYDKEIVFLPRHGKAHHISPSTINYRANIYGMKKLNVGRIISVSAVGSLREKIKPLDFVIPDQFVDRTNKGRKSSFFDQGVVAHVSFAHPVCENLAHLVESTVHNIEVTVHFGGTYVNIEGPQFSTYAESQLYRSWEMDIVGMTNMTEARLAREAEICYVTLAAVTDYDCWHETEETVTVDAVLENLRKNVANAKQILKETIALIPEQRTCACSEALKYAVITRSKAIPEKIKKDLDIIIGKYVK